MPFEPTARLRQNMSHEYRAFQKHPKLIARRHRKPESLLAKSVEPRRTTRPRRAEPARSDRAAVSTKINKASYINMAYATRSKTSSSEDRDDKIDVPRDLRNPISSQRRPARRRTASKKKTSSVKRESPGDSGDGNHSPRASTPKRRKSDKLEKIECWQPLRW